MNGDRVEQILRDYGGLRDPNADPDLEAVKIALLIEDVFGIALSEADIDAGVLADPSALARLITRSRRSI